MPSPVAPNFSVLPEFRETSYAKRYELFCLKLIRERLYDAVCFLLSENRGGTRVGYREPSTELSFGNFVASLTGRLIGYKSLGGGDRR